MVENSNSLQNEWTFQRTMLATLSLGMVAFGFWLLYRFYFVVFILFIAIVIGTLIRPAVNWMHLKGLPRILGVLIIYLLLLSMLVGFLFLLLPIIIEQGTTIFNAMPGYYQNFREGLVNSPNQFVVSLGRFTPAALSSIIADTSQQTGAEVMATAEQILNYLKSTAKVSFTAMVLLVLVFYWTLDGPRTIKSLLLLVAQDKREGIETLISAMETKVGSFLVGQGLLCLIIGLLSLIAYLIIGLPNALVLALVAGILEAVPMIGPLLGAIPALLVALILGPDKLIWVIVASIVIQQAENYFLVPRVMSKAVGINPFVSILAFFAFGSQLGIGGALMAIPMAAILQLFLKHFVFDPGVTEAEASTGRDFTSRLRYEAQDLAQDLRKQSRLKTGGSDKRVKQIDQIVDEIETITTDLDALLAQLPPSGTP